MVCRFPHRFPSPTGQEITPRIRNDNIQFTDKQHIVHDKKEFQLRFMKPIIDHIQITVKDIKVAEDFYDKFLHVLGFNINNKVSAFIEEHDFHVIEYSHELLAFAITSPRQAFMNDSINRRKPGALHHLAFKADSQAEVDNAYLELLKIGAIIVSEPQIHPEYSENYYAVYFKDMENIKLCVTKNEKTLLSTKNEIMSYLYIRSNYKYQCQVNLNLSTEITSSFLLVMTFIAKTRNEDEAICI